ncbi:hypothetical protein BVRB_5g109650 [Beta vulgaris subsp. vulgaris]|nr:hypothetical protein BVRB_5g109650 [Beta vulgaris subsp. vulgaris]
MMSILFRNNKQHDQERCKDHKPRDVAKRGSKKSRSNEVPRDSSTSSSINCKFGAGNVVNLTVNGGKISRVKSVRDIEEHSEAKGGLKIKRIIKIKSREREKEKRFELCKKKILMGEKCKPLHGSLHYDKNGVLVPEDFT